MGGEKGLASLLLQANLKKIADKYCGFLKRGPFFSLYCSFELKLCHENFIYELPL